MNCAMMMNAHNDVYYCVVDIYIYQNEIYIYINKIHRAASWTTIKGLLIIIESICIS
jgi:hypothetical protein